MIGLGVLIWVVFEVGFLPIVGVGGAMWIYAVLYLISAGLTLLLTLPGEGAGAES